MINLKGEWALLDADGHEYMRIKFPDHPVAISKQGAPISGIITAIHGNPVNPLEYPQVYGGVYNDARGIQICDPTTEQRAYHAPLPRANNTTTGEYKKGLPHDPNERHSFTMKLVNGL